MVAGRVNAARRVGQSYPDPPGFLCLGCVYRSVALPAHCGRVARCRRGLWKSGRTVSSAPPVSGPIGGGGVGGGGGGELGSEVSRQVTTALPRKVTAAAAAGGGLMKRRQH